MPGGKPLLLTALLQAAALSVSCHLAVVQASDFSMFAPALQTWVELSREKAAAIDPNAPVYDVLLDTYEKGMTSARLDQIFAEVGPLPGVGLRGPPHLPCFAFFQADGGKRCLAVRQRRFWDTHDKRVT